MRFAWLRAALTVAAAAFAFAANADTLTPLPGTTPQTTFSTGFFPVQVGVVARDDAGNPIAGLPVSFHTVSAYSFLYGADASPYVATTDAAGVAMMLPTFLAINPGSFTMLVTTPSIPQPASFDFTVTDETGMTVEWLTGQNQSAPTGGAFTGPITLRLRLPNGAPAPYALATFNAIDNGAGANGVIMGDGRTWTGDQIAIADANGIVTAPPIVANGTPGTWRLHFFAGHNVNAFGFLTNSVPVTNTPATKTWTGNGMTNHWSEGANWQGGIPPGPGDTLVFGGTNGSMSNDVGPGPYVSMTFNGSASYYITGAGVTLTSATPVTAATAVDFALAVRLTNSAPVVSSSNSIVSFDAGLEIGGALEMRTTTYGQVQVLGQTTESSPSSVTFNGPGQATLFGTSLVSGGYTFNGTRVTVNGPVAIGLNNVPLQFGDFGAVNFYTVSGPAYVVSKPLVFSGNSAYVFPSISTEGSQRVELSGSVSFNGASPTLYGNDLLVSGPVSGTSTMVVYGPGVTFSNPANSFSGGLNLQAQFHTGASEVIPDSNDVWASASALFDIGTYTETVRALHCTEGTLAIRGGGLLRVRAPSDLGNCTLLYTPDPGFTPSANQVVTLVANDSGAPLTGIFNALPEGSLVHVNGVDMALSYRGGRALDVVLTVPPPPDTTPHLDFSPSAYLTQSGTSFILHVYQKVGVIPTAGATITLGYSCVPDSACLQASSLVGTTDANGHVAFTVYANEHPGIYTVTATSGSLIASGTVNQLSSTTSVPPQLNVQDMWWVPSENGWGMSLVQHNDTLFGALYIYDRNGKPIWVVLPGGSWDSTHMIYSGQVYKPIGTPFYTYNAQGLFAGAPVGNISITFQDANNAILDYTIAGVTGRKLVTREIFATGSASWPNRSDLWWGGASQNGWGITLLQQASTLFGVWYTYDANNDPFWYVMPGGTWTSSDTYEGALYRTSASAWVESPYDSSKLQVMSAGTFKFQFSGDNATFTYNADGHGGSVPLTRQPF